MSRVQELPPDPERVINGLRDTGYQFDTAIADIIDNSISADADKIFVEIKLDMGGDVLVSICDNGYGMDEEDVLNAMKYGSKKRVKDKYSLSKFGLGMKTASTAFCRRLSVISRNAKGGEVCKAVWDLDHVAKSGKWELLLETPEKEELKSLDASTQQNTGTMVKWEKVDRLFAADVSKKQAAVTKHVKKLKEHLSLVYQRFLDKLDKRAKSIEIFVNGEKIDPLDPFCVSEVKKPVAEDKKKIVLLNKKHAYFTIKAYVLPRKSDFKNQALAEKARINNDNQGFYIYRENRLIHGPDWLDMFRKEPHYSLLRVEFSFESDMDEAFHIDIKKSQIILNDALSDWMEKEFMPGPRREAERIYRHGQQQLIANGNHIDHSASNNTIAAVAGRIENATVSAQGKNTAIVENKHGKTTMTVFIEESDHNKKVHVKDVDSVTDGLLWEPALLDGCHGVRINKTHDYFRKVYLPNRSENVTIQGLDSLLWALSEAEFETVNEHTKRYFQELRFAVSKILRELVSELPDPKLGDE